MPVHSVELSHFVLLNVDVEDTGTYISRFCCPPLLETCILYPIVFKPSDFAIINTDGHSDFDIESRLTLRDHLDRRLDLKLNYMLVRSLFRRRDF